MQRVIVTDHVFPSLDIEKGVLEPLGLSVEDGQCREPAELINHLQRADFVLTQFASLTDDVISTLVNTQLIVRYGIGVDNVDIAAAQKLGIPVCNVPDYCTDEVADHTVALILAATRQVVANAGAAPRGEWRLAVPLRTMRCLKAMTVGIVGFGRIGREVALRLQPFKCRIVVFDPAVPDRDVVHLGFIPVRFDELLAVSDVVTLHCPCNDSTYHLIDSRAFAKMKEQAILVNVARGAIVCMDSLLENLRSGSLGFAALDVLETEPVAPDHPLLSLSNVLIHCHIASASEEAVTRLRHTAASLVALAAQGKPLRNVVNGVSSAPVAAGAYLKEHAL